MTTTTKFNVSIPCDSESMRWAAQVYNALLDIEQWHGDAAHCAAALSHIESASLTSLAAELAEGKALGFRMKVRGPVFVIEQENNDYGDPENAAAFLRTFLARWLPGERLTLSWESVDKSGRAGQGALTISGGTTIPKD